MITMISLKEAAAYLQTNDNYIILTHQYPDGDTLGSAFGLCKMLQQIGKNAMVLYNGQLQDRFAYLANGVSEQSFTKETVISVDVADKALLGELVEYSSRVELCIDHHSIHRQYAKRSYVDPTAAATAEIIYLIGELLGVEYTKDIADCVYTGVATDTGCFKFSNTTLQTHEIAGRMIQCGCDFARINKDMFDTITKAHIAIEQKALETLAYYADGECAVMYTTKEMCIQCGATDDDIEGLSSVPRKIVGVRVGITIRQKGDDLYKISVRTNGGVNAAEICSIFGGGGHPAAAGCTIDGTLDKVIERLVAAAAVALKNSRD